MICKLCPNVHTLWISLSVRSTERTAGLDKALRLFNPKTLYVQCHSRTNRASLVVQSVVEMVIAECWTELVRALSCHQNMDSSAFRHRDQSMRMNFWR